MYEAVGMYVNYPEPEPEPGAGTGEIVGIVVMFARMGRN